MIYLKYIIKRLILKKSKKTYRILQNKLTEELITVNMKV